MRETHLFWKRQSLADLPEVLLGVSPDLPFRPGRHIVRHNAPGLPDIFEAGEELFVLLARPPPTIVSPLAAAAVVVNQPSSPFVGGWFQRPRSRAGGWWAAAAAHTVVIT